MPRLLLLAAGFPEPIGTPLCKKLARANPGVEAVPTIPFEGRFYTAVYADELYDQVTTYFKKALSTPGADPWKINFVLLYTRNGDDSDRYLIDRFGMEALLVPVSPTQRVQKAPQLHKNQESVNQLFRKSNKLLRNARNVLRTLAQEVTNRDNKTCVLLPRKNFGSKVNDIADFIHNSVETCERVETFANSLRYLEGLLPRSSSGRFEGKGLEFYAPSKAAARHGIAPSWCKGDHKPSCVIRGRLRFGVCFDPKFHYDCKFRKSRRGPSSRCFPSCHKEHRIRRGRNHINIAPNDNIR